MATTTFFHVMNCRRKWKAPPHTRRTPYREIIFFIVIILSLSIFALSGCSDEPVTRVDLDEREQPTLEKEKNTITYAYLPQYSHTISYRRHRMIVEYLRQETGLPLSQIFPDTFDEHLTMMARGEIDISFSNPFIYIKIARAGGRAFARVVESTGHPDFRGQIIIRKDNREIRTLQDCRGKRWIAVDPLSAGGYLFVLGHFREHGIQPDDFAEIAFAPGPGGKQEKVVLAVYAGAYDLGSIREGTLSIMEGKVNTEEIRILDQTRPYPGWVFSARNGLSRDIVENIAEALYRLDIATPRHAAILETARIKGIIPACDSDYDSIRTLASTLGQF